jgi:hypothetical protein
MPLQGGIKPKRGYIDIEAQLTSCHALSPRLPANRCRGREARKSNGTRVRRYLATSS